MESPKLQKETRNSVPKGGEGALLLVRCCPTWQDIQRDASQLQERG